MTPPTQPHEERLLDLLALRAVEALNEADEAAVASLDDAAAFDQAAAVLAMGFSVHEGLEPLPDSLRRGLERLGRDLIAGRELGNASPVNGVAARAASDTVEPAPLRFNGRNSNQSETRPETSSHTSGWIGVLGWLAAAACLALAVIGWSLPRDTPASSAPASAESLLASLETRPGIVRTSWVGLDAAGLNDAAHAYGRDLSGGVVWDPATNEGYMVFEGLASNDPAVFQYQLWIFDETRPTGDLPQFGEGILSQRPVPGAVFDVRGDGRVVVPVQAKLPVGKAVIFAVTVEPPGGVVVSDRDIVTLALVN